MEDLFIGVKSRPYNMSGLESILEKNTDVKYKERCHPTSVSRFEENLKNSSLKGMNKEL